ncbi:MAG TPA: peptidyl-dipeptidase Dcp [Thermoanaerobaculaceae bacterium]|nr:MAG: dipeptidyl carboxypeptidase II [Acidobacteria bacterium 37-71-11]HQT93910.1 peptidyl-dipeptidase Dcp [Thermoanaerobaculaceae bacterium]HQU33039.1 peptidyl-dipeptidase Dcp [Thermoanaerobaculaceae bacterium]
MLRTLTLSIVGAAALVGIFATSASAGENTPVAGAKAAARTNPFFTASPLPFQAPPFDKIRDDDFKPALDEGIKLQRLEVEKIADNPARASFENTLVALERSGQLLTRVNMVFNGLSSANTDPALQKLQEEMAPKLAALHDTIFLNPKLFKRVEAIYEERSTLKLDPESLRLVEYYHQQFVHAGARLSDADQATLKQLNERDAALSAKFVNQLLAAAKAGALVVSDKAELAGFGPGELDAAAQAAKARGFEGKWLIPLQNTTQQPALSSLTDRATREKLFRASWLRAEHGDANDTRATISELAMLRAEKAKLLGFPSYAAWRLEDQMAKTPATVESFLGKLVPPAIANARREAAEIQALIDQQHGGFTLEPWDWEFYADQVRKAKYDLDEAQLKPYFELNRVLEDGVFYAAHELYGLTFKERHDIPVYNPDVRVFEVFDRDGSPLALFYCDYFKRDNKSGGAWMDNFVGQSKLFGTKPVVYNVANFTKPAPGQPALLSWDDVTTMFHEFGHGLHGMFANQEYPSLSGTNVARDFVEFPSQINEHWALDPKVLAHYAINGATGKPMPQELADKIRKAATFNQGYDLTEILAASELDMQWHTLSAAAPAQAVDPFEAEALKVTGVDLSQVPPRYRSSYFLHIWSNGYAAGYYAYLWAEMLDDDAFAWFGENGGLTRANGDRFRAMILSRGNTEDLAKMYRDFRGRDPKIEPMLETRGLLKK